MSKMSDLHARGIDDLYSYTEGLQDGKTQSLVKFIKTLNDRICPERHEGASCGHSACYHMEEVVYDLEMELKELQQENA